jgi:hypothetical protein
MNEGPVRSRRFVRRHAADEVWISLFHPLERFYEERRVGTGHAAITVEIIHPTVAVAIDEHVGSIAVLMPRITGSTTT